LSIAADKSPVKAPVWLDCGNPGPEAGSGAGQPLPDPVQQSGGRTDQHVEGRRSAAAQRQQPVDQRQSLGLEAIHLPIAGNQWAAQHILRPFHAQSPRAAQISRKIRHRAHSTKPTRSITFFSGNRSNPVKLL
jgi:hypothetical protein